MNQKKIKEQVLANASKLILLKEQITQTLKSKTTNLVAWQIACDNFNKQYDSLAFPGGLAKGLKALKNCESSAIMVAIEFLKANPYYHRSGYHKQKIAHLLKNAPLSKLQVNDLQEFLLESLKNKNFFCLEYARLARQIQDAAFKIKIEELIESSNNEHEITNAKKMLNTIKS